ncbi:hypothetical protein ABT404_08925 [Streptomyces hyaluromycini]|uniref:Secreted protein n=1 Tax=Streptomyces hyaluromycini TaxID=1377993 RepID=A0ABV1WT57_9ACTN
MAVAFLGQLLLAVVHAELSSRFAVTGGVCQWGRRPARLYLGINLLEGDPVKPFRPRTKLADPAPTPHTEERKAS